MNWTMSLEPSANSPPPRSDTSADTQSLEAGLSLIVPVYKNEDDIHDLLCALEGFHSRHGAAFEAVLVVDGSPDQSWRLLRSGLDDLSIPSQLILLSRNFGAFSAIRAGLAVARFTITAVMSADLQEPPELIEDFYSLLSRKDAALAVGVRTTRDDPVVKRILSALYWRFYRRWVMPSLPRGGVDVFACTPPVRQVLLSLREPNSSLVAQLCWIGFNRIEIPYRRRKRARGKSAWTFRRRFRYMLDSVFGFSDLPIVLLLWIGMVGVAASLIAAIIVLLSWFMGGISVAGYTPILLSILFVGSLLLTGQGIVGAYVWRAAENTKLRPLSIVASHEVLGQGTRNED
jgi:glycosyltransferase involved in cell wall biosynthesis